MPNVTLREINNAVLTDAEGYIEKCESRYRQVIASISNDVCRQQGRMIVMLAGPSSSGKTTTAKLLKENIIKNGRHASVVSLDDFYLDQEVSYTFEDGTVDYETIKALDTDLIISCLIELVERGESNIPRFSFHSKKRESFEKMSVANDEIIIVEGLHALNPIITEPLEKENMLKLYVSVSSRIFDGDKILLSKRDIRFIRRLIRDYHFRNSSAEYTFYLWNGVRMGEDRYLFPFSGNADVKIDSIHPYEICLFKNIATQLLDHIDSNSVYYASAKRLKDKLSMFVSLNKTVTDEKSLLKEFIG